MTSQRAPRTTWAPAGDHGGAAVELVLLTPLLLALLLFAVLAGRLAQARAEVDGAARDAARAASIARAPAAARAAARVAAAATLGDRRVTCRTLKVATDTSAFRAGGHVAVDVACTVDLADLALLRLPGRRTVHARFTAPLDTFRETR
jgi:Flp pilus assembly protein TadG